MKDLKRLSQICNEVNDAKDIETLSPIWDYVMKYKKHYPLSQVHFMLEYIELKVIDLNAKKIVI